jgi:hypothetical protein
MGQRLISLTGMKTLNDIAKFLRHIVMLLTAVEELRIEDCWEAPVSYATPFATTFMAFPLTRAPRVPPSRSVPHILPPPL